jgi:hypothetical protein
VFSGGAFARRDAGRDLQQPTELFRDVHCSVDESRVQKVKCHGKGNDSFVHAQNRQGEEQL